ncbi:dentin sialophospho protein [Striga asiatica]|uniref:Dentin sialophospho protein n=1 Tax=Striga asiatica TaxID=4170 RepID=A0A5A7QWI1_STRAF|nr:dentin sialophospho protein [Striga asiatica]
MPQAPVELIRHVQICTRSAADLPGYNPSNPTLPALTPLSAAIAASHPSPPQLRCKNCKATLLRGSESIICAYCGLAPRDGGVSDPISFTSTVGYQWLLRSLRLDGSEMVDQTQKREQNQGYNSPKSLTPLSKFLNFKISRPAKTEKQEIVLSEKNSEQNEGSLRLTVVAPDKFFLKSQKDILSDMSSGQPFTGNRIGTSDERKTVAAFGHRNSLQNVESSEPADSSSKAFSEWEAEFQSADSENRHEFPDASFED